MRVICEVGKDSDLPVVALQTSTSEPPRVDVAMNGTQAQETTAAAKAGQTQGTHASDEAKAPEPPLMAGANGSSSLSKKRKKDGLKPIITTEGPSPTG